MSKHTPGPWQTNGFNIFGPLDPKSNHMNGRTLVGGVVDDVNDWRCRPTSEPIERAEFREERIANANLIAAAPELLEALVWHFGAEESCERCAKQGGRCLAHAAIAKAEGAK